MTVPGIIIKSKFTLPTKQNTRKGSKEFDDYVTYMDREEAKEEEKAKGGLEKEEYELYHNYMGDEKKASGLFTKYDDQLNKKQLKEAKEVFKLAQKNNSVMWQDVISFDNEWLEQNGIYDSKTKTLDEKKMKVVTREAMNTMLQKENMEDAVWTAAIHYNTDNIHVHIATVEPIPTRERGKRKQSSLDAMKSKVSSKLMDRSKKRERINDLMQNKIVI